MRLISLLSVALLLGCHEDVVNTYVSAQEARAAGAIDRGWIPRLLPPSAKFIREKHNIDTNESWGRFEFSASDARGLASAVTPIRSGADRECVRDPHVNWWPLSNRDP